MVLNRLRDCSRLMNASSLDTMLVVASCLRMLSIRTLKLKDCCKLVATRSGS